MSRVKLNEITKKEIKSISYINNIVNIMLYLIIAINEDK